MKKRFCFLLIFLFSAITLFADRGIDVGSQANRIALVVGNGAYEVGPLKNPVNDARDMTAVLKSKGFKVTLLTNATQRQMEKAIGAFGKQLRDGGVGLFFYAGHGMQVAGTNYLIPIGANIEAEEDIRFESVNANRVLAKMQAAGNGLNMVFLDACRNNPFARSFRSSGKGLAQMDAPKGSFVAFATAPGSVAADGDDRNGLFTGQLIRQIRSSGLPLTQLMMEVRKGVLRDSENRQTPWDVSSLTGDFYFSGDGKTDLISKPHVVKKQPIQKPVAVASAMESEMWEMVKDSRNITDLEIFLESHPDGLYRSHAESRIWLLAAQSPESIKAYLKKYPDSPYKKAAEKRIWEVYRKDDTLEKFEEFIREFPENQYVGFAKLKVSQLKQEKKLWARAKNSLKKEDLQDYLDRYPNGKYSGLARKYLAVPPDMVPVPAGEFEMGSNEGDADEKPVHRVYLNEYFIDRYEVTVKQYQECHKAGICRKPSTGDYYNWGKPDRSNHPINGVSWHDAKAYCEFVEKRLPTEAEWEKAATWKDERKFRYPSGKESVSCADAVMDKGGIGCGKSRTWPVGSKAKEINGTYDMAGNVWEWVADWYGKSYYGNSPSRNPTGPSSGSDRGVRGGSWDYTASGLRGAFRGSHVPSHRYYNVGFRCARSPK